MFTKNDGLNKPKVDKRVIKPPKDSFGLDIRQLRKWREEKLQQELNTEQAKQEIAVRKVRTFLDAIATVVRLQSWWRMCLDRHKYLAILYQRKEIKKTFYRAWKIYWKSEQLYLYHVQNKFYYAWRDEIRDQKRLQKLIQKFFLICIKRMRLSPQACMAYFNPGEWTNEVDPADMAKIRRLMIQKLFDGWRTESHDLKIMRYKATQVLSRMVRRTKGPLWIKESTLVCFHMWYRYIAVKRAFRRGEPDPRFNNPFLPQWAKLFKDITVSRVKKKRTLENGQKLTQMRAFNKWLYLMSVDRSKPVTPLAVAISHYIKVLTTKVFYAWYYYLRERGKIARFRDKIFFIWKFWAPKHKKLRQFNHLATEWLRIQRVRKSFHFMASICQKVIGKRTKKMKDLRRNFCDRRVMLCAYALLNKNEHVMMVDCWRRFKCYWHARRQWKTLNWQMSYAWYEHKMKLIWNAWKYYVAVKKGRIVLESRHGGVLSLDWDNSTVNSLDNISIDNLSQETPASIAALMQGLSIDSEKKPELPSEIQGMETHLMSITHELFLQVKQQSISFIPNILQFVFLSKALTIAYHTILARIPAHKSMLSSSSSQAAVTPSDPSDPPSQPNFDPPQLTAETPSAEVKADDNAPPPGPLGRVPINKTFSNSSITTFQTLEPALKHQQLVSQSLANHNEHLHTSVYLETYIQQITNPQLYQRFYHAIEIMDLNEFLACIQEGVIIHPSIVQQYTYHIGDHYLPYFTLLLMNNHYFFLERLLKEDISEYLSSCQNPMVSFLLANQLERWSQQDLTIREYSTITQDIFLSSTVSHSFLSIYLWRNIVLQNVELKLHELIHTCRILPIPHTVEEEVIEVIKRNKAEKYVKLLYNLFTLSGETPIWTIEERKLRDIPPLTLDPPSEITGDVFVTDSEINNLAIMKTIRHNSMPTGSQFTKSFIDSLSIGSQHSPNSTAASVDPNENNIYHVLREYTLLTGRLTTEARALRTPLMERDRILLANGFMKQAKKEYLQLRMECMSKEEKKNYELKQIKAKKEQEKTIEKEKKKLQKTIRSSVEFSAIQELIHDETNPEDGNSPNKDTKSKKTDKKSQTKGKKKSKKQKSKASIPFVTESEENPNYLLYSAKDFKPINEQELNYHYPFKITSIFDPSLSLIALEEHELQNEQMFQQRIAMYAHPIYMETYAINPWKYSDEEELIQEHYRHQIITMMKHIVYRIYYVFQQALLTIQHTNVSFSAPNLLTNFSYASLRANDHLPNFSLYLLDQIVLTRNNPHASIHSLLVQSKDFYQYKLLKERLEIEILLLQQKKDELRQQFYQITQTSDDVHNNIQEYNKYLKQLRKDIILIAEKQRNKSLVDVHDKHVKLKSYQSVERSLGQITSYYQNKTQKYKQLMNQVEQLQAKQHLRRGSSFTLVKSMRSMTKLDTENDENVNNSDPNNDDSSPADPPAPLLSNNNHISLQDEEEMKKEIMELAEYMINFWSSGPANPLHKPSLDPETDEEEKKKKDLTMYTTLDTITELLNDYGNELDVIESQVKEVRNKQLQTHREMTQFDSLCYRTNKLYKSLALDKFNNLLDIQQMTNQTNKQLDQQILTQEEIKQLFLFYNKYQIMLKYFLEKILLLRGQQLTKENELKRFQELMSRPSSNADATANNLPYLTPTLSNNNLRDSMTFNAMFASSPSSSSLLGGGIHASQPSSKQPSRDFTSESAAFLHDKQRQTSMRKSMLVMDAEGFLGDTMNPTITEEKETDDLMGFHGANSILSEETLDSESVFSELEPPAALIPENQTTHPTNKVVLTDHEPGYAYTDEELKEIDRILKTNERKLTFDEEMAIVQYNSPENLLKREEELRLLEEQKAMDLENQELRMRIFDDYWQSYPRKELTYSESPDYEDDKTIDTHEEEENKRKSNKNAAKKSLLNDEDEDEDEDEEDDELNDDLDDDLDDEDDESNLKKSKKRKKKKPKNRNQRLWQQIGDTYWREKEEAIKQMIEKQSDLSGLDPDSIESVSNKEKTEPDPLDSELKELKEYHQRMAEDDLQFNLLEEEDQQPRTPPTEWVNHVYSPFKDICVEDMFSHRLQDINGDDIALSVSMKLFNEQQLQLLAPPIKDLPKSPSKVDQKPANKPTNDEVSQRKRALSTDSLGSKSDTSSVSPSRKGSAFNKQHSSDQTINETDENKETNDNNPNNDKETEETTESKPAEDMEKSLKIIPKVDFFGLVGRTEYRRIRQNIHTRSTRPYLHEYSESSFLSPQLQRYQALNDPEHASEHTNSQIEFNDEDDNHSEITATSSIDHQTQVDHYLTMINMTDSFCDPASRPDTTNQPSDENKPEGILSTGKPRKSDNGNNIDKNVQFASSETEKKSPKKRRTTSAKPLNNSNNSSPERPKSPQTPKTPMTPLSKSRSAFNLNAIVSNSPEDRVTVPKSRQQRQTIAVDPSGSGSSPSRRRSTEFSSPSTPKSRQSSIKRSMTTKQSFSKPLEDAVKAVEGDLSSPSASIVSPLGSTTSSPVDKTSPSSKRKRKTQVNKPSSPGSKSGFTPPMSPNMSHMLDEAEKSRVSIRFKKNPPKENAYQSSLPKEFLEKVDDLDEEEGEGQGEIVKEGGAMNPQPSTFLEMPSIQSTNTTTNTPQSSLLRDSSPLSISHDQAQDHRQLNAPIPNFLLRGKTFRSLTEGTPLEGLGDHDITDSLTSEPQPRLIEQLGLEFDPIEIHDGKDFFKTIDDLRKETEKHELENVKPPKDNPYLPKYTFFPANFKVIEPVRSPRNRSRKAKTPRTPQEPPPNSPHKVSHTSDMPSIRHSAFIDPSLFFSEESMDKFDPTTVEGDSLSLGEVSGLGDQLRIFVKSRHGEAQPRNISPGKLRTSESHASLITKAQNMASNPYDLVIPQPTSSDYQVYVPGRVIKQERDDISTDSVKLPRPAPLFIPNSQNKYDYFDDSLDDSPMAAQEVNHLVPEGHVVLKRAGTPEFWIHVTKALPNPSLPSLSTSHSKHSKVDDTSQLTEQPHSSLEEDRLRGVQGFVLTPSLAYPPQGNSTTQSTLKGVNSGNKQMLPKNTKLFAKPTIIHTSSSKNRQDLFQQQTLRTMSSEIVQGSNPLTQYDRHKHNQQHHPPQQESFKDSQQTSSQGDNSSYNYHNNYNYNTNTSSDQPSLRSSTPATSLQILKEIVGQNYELGDNDNWSFMLSKDNSIEDPRHHSHHPPHLQQPTDLPAQQTNFTPKSTAINSNKSFDDWSLPLSAPSGPQFINDSIGPEPSFPSIPIAFVDGLLEETDDLLPGQRPKYRNSSYSRSLLDADMQLTDEKAYLSGDLSQILQTKTIVKPKETEKSQEKAQEKAQMKANTLLSLQPPVIIDDELPASPINTPANISRQSSKPLYSMMNADMEAAIEEELRQMLHPSSPSSHSSRSYGGGGGFQGAKTMSALPSQPFPIVFQDPNSSNNNNSNKGTLFPTVETANKRPTKQLKPTRGLAHPKLNTSQSQPGLLPNVLVLTSSPTHSTNKNTKEGFVGSNNTNATKKFAANKSLASVLPLLLPPKTTISQPMSLSASSKSSSMSSLPSTNPSISINISQTHK